MSTEPTTNATWPPRNFKGYGKDGIQPQWPGNAKICVSLCLNIEEGGEVSAKRLCGKTAQAQTRMLTPRPSQYEVALGDERGESYLGEISGRGFKTVRDPSIESEFEYGARAGVWRLLRMFDALKVKVRSGYLVCVTVQPI